MTGDAWPHEVREVIRLGLIGGGMKTDRALVLVKRHVEGRPLFRVAAGSAHHPASRDVRAAG